MGIGRDGLRWVEPTTLSGKPLAVQAFLCHLQAVRLHIRPAMAKKEHLRHSRRRCKKDKRNVSKDNKKKQSKRENNDEANKEKKQLIRKEVLNNRKN
jgi:hypothetical protein